MTWAKTGEIKKEDVLSSLEAAFKPRLVERYVICEEKHKDGSNHIHGYVGLNGRCDIRCPKRLDIGPDGSEKIHGNYQSCRSYGAVIRYIVKDSVENVLTNLELNDDGREIGT